MRHALEAARARGVPHLNISGTANQLEAELLELVEDLAAATGRTLTWTGGSQSAAFDRQTSTASSSRTPFTHMANRLVEASGLRQRRHRHASRGGDAYVICASSASEVAERLSVCMTRTLARPCQLLMPAHDEGAAMEACLEHVARSKYVVLLQTESALAQPQVLLAAYRAALARVPMVCVVVTGGGYDFDDAKEHLDNLETRLGPEACAQIRGTLSRWSPPKDVADLQSQLAELIPNIISVRMDPAGTDIKLVATVRDIHDKYKLLSRLAQETKRKHTRVRQRCSCSRLRVQHTSTSSMSKTSVEEASVAIEMEASGYE